MVKLTSKKHVRRKDYWKYYELYRKIRDPFWSSMILNLIYDGSRPIPEASVRGRNRYHSIEKLDYACFAMTSNNGTYEDARNSLLPMGNIWKENLPSHKELVTHMSTINSDWLDLIVARTAFLCLDVISLYGATAPLAVDSSAIETTRYTAVDVPNMTLDDFASLGIEAPRIRTYLKHHVTSVLGHQIILTAVTTPSNVHDGEVLPQMLEMYDKFGFDFSGRRFNADKAYDWEALYKLIIEHGMIPNIPRRKSPSGKYVSNPAKIYRNLAASMFNPVEYKLRSLIEAIFGAEETKNHQLKCRFLLEENRIKFSKFRAISWNINVLCRFMCANYLGIKIPSYGDSEDVTQLDLKQQVLC